MIIPIVGGAYKSRSVNINAQRCQNLYPVIDDKANVTALVNTPGLKLFASLGTGEIRGMCTQGDILYVISGSTGYSIDANGIKTTFTGSLSTSTGPVWMATNGTQIMIVDGSGGYMMTAGTITGISDTDFPVPSSLTYQDGYFIVSKKDSGQWFISGSYDGTTWDALDYATAEAYPDNLQAVVSCQREIWLLGKESYEVWYDSGNADFPWTRVNGAVSKVGCIAPHSVGSYEGSIAWLDDKRQVRMSNQYQAAKISTEQIDYQIAQYGTVSDAIGYGYSQEGHIFYVLTFPTESKTWCYDATTKHWHTRASGNHDGRHPATCHVLFNSKNLIGHTNGNVYEYDLGVYSDAGVTVRRIRSAQAIHKERRSVFHSSLELRMEAGTGLIVDDPDIDSGLTPQAMLRWSDDSGHTWSNEHWENIGTIGSYKQRVRWTRLGYSRDRVYEVTISDPIKVVITQATLNAEQGVS